MTAPVSFRKKVRFFFPCTVHTLPTAAFRRSVLLCCTMRHSDMVGRDPRRATGTHAATQIHHAARRHGSLFGGSPRVGAAVDDAGGWISRLDLPGDERQAPGR